MRKASARWTASSRQRSGQPCIQLHGGIGVTDKCAASHYFKPLTTALLGALADEATARAVLSAVRHARNAAGLPAARDLAGAL